MSFSTLPLAAADVRVILTTMTLSVRRILLNILVVPGIVFLLLVVLVWLSWSQGQYPGDYPSPIETIIWWNIHRSGAPTDLPWTMAGISFMVVVPLIGEFVLRRHFGRSPSPEVFFLRLFLLSLPFQAVRLLIPVFLTGTLPVFLAGSATRIAWFARLTGLVVLLNTGLYAGEIPFQRSGAILSTGTLAIIALAVTIPLDQTQLLGNLLIRSGGDDSLFLICFVMEILSVLTLIGSAVSQKKNRYYILAGMLLLIVAGTDMVFFASQALVIPGAALFTAGMVGFALEIRRIYLWV